ncbi:hypothetical protein M8C21_001066 [Ambrosia artemisiifolia]|uniref:Uncharacterized protein n=1 Tax=Ambrosia artemisiifolia TaxID=4212 RepID=A0AAD5G5U2_AMBAR|nr:hypothetical protein M8C21_001066 [Ambrosia artemisiifolia]
MEASEGTKALERPEYVNLSEYPPGTDIESELHFDGCRVVSKVPRWAHEKWLRKYQNAGDSDGTIPPQDASPSEFFNPCFEKRHIVVYPRFASATAAAAASGAKTLKRPREEIPPETVAAYAEVTALNPRLAKVYPDVYSYHRHPDRYGFFMEKGRIVCKLKKWAGPITTSKAKGRYFPPKPIKDDIHQLVPKLKIMCRQAQGKPLIDNPNPPCSTQDPFGCK